MSSKTNDLITNTLARLCDNELEDTYILHIPHAGEEIPDFKHYLLPKETILEEHQLLADTGTDELFKTPFTSMVFPYSRVYCDVERLPDSQEEMFCKGRGFYYTHTDGGRELRTLDDKNNVKALYEDWHYKLESLVQDKLDKYNLATIIDCHSFSDTPFQSDLIKTTIRPDFCLGTDAYHTPHYIVSFIKQRLENEGFSVAINTPYSGTIVPLKYYQKDENVNSIMIEINRKLFYDGTTILPHKVEQLKEIINNILLYHDYVLPKNKN